MGHGVHGLSVPAVDRYCKVFHTVAVEYYIIALELYTVRPRAAALPHSNTVERQSEKE